MWAATITLRRSEDKTDEIYDLCRDACQDTPLGTYRSHKSEKEINQTIGDALIHLRKTDTSADRRTAFDALFLQESFSEHTQTQLDHGMVAPHASQLVRSSHQLHGQLPTRSTSADTPVDAVVTHEHSPQTVAPAKKTKREPRTSSNTKLVQRLRFIRQQADIGKDAKEILDELEKSEAPFENG